MRIPWLLIELINLACVQNAEAQEKISFAEKLIYFPSRSNERVQECRDMLNDPDKKLTQPNTVPAGLQTWNPWHRVIA